VGRARFVELRLERGDQPRMAAAQVVDAGATDIHVSSTGRILEPDAFGSACRPRARNGLVREVRPLACGSYLTIDGKRLASARRRGRRGPVAGGLPKGLRILVNASIAVRPRTDTSQAAAAVRAG
jgi:hypothetical protein